MVVNKQKLRIIYFVVSIVFFTGAILTVAGDILGTASPQGDPMQRAVYLAIYVFMLPLLFLKFNYIRSLLISEKLLTLILLISILSVFWSALPMITTRRVIALLLTTLFAILFGSYYKLHDQISILSYSFGLIVIMCFLFPILFPDLGIHLYGGHAGLWRGVFVQKNTMASILVLSVLVFVYKIRSEQKNRMIFVFLLGLSFLLIILSWSTTALLSIVFVYISIYIFKFYAKLNRKNLAVNFVFIAIILAFLSFYLINNLDYLFSLFGKDLTLTGRIPLWIILFNSSKEKLLLGYGYEAYWNGIGSPSEYVLRQLFWVPNDAHNGYIDVILSVGIIGLMLVILKVIDIFNSTKALYNTTKDKKLLLVISIIVYVLILNVTSTSILVQNSVFWILLISLSIGIRDEKNRLNQSEILKT